MSEVILKEISKKLDYLIALTATHGSDLNTKIKVLSSLGVSNAEIGKLTGMTGENVRLKLKKSGNKKK